MAAGGVLTVSVCTLGVTAVVATSDAGVVARGHRDVERDSTGPDLSEMAPETLWQAVLAATRDCLEGCRDEVGELLGLHVTGRSETVLVWDRETLGSPRPAILPEDQRAVEVCHRIHGEGRGERVSAIAARALDPRATGPRLRWLAENEPNTWALVLDGRYALGPEASYLVARMSRGTWHVTDRSHATGTLLLDAATGAWSRELCGVFGVPLEALPELVLAQGPLARTDPRSFLGLDLPVLALRSDAASADGPRT